MKKSEAKRVGREGARRPWLFLLLSGILSSGASACNVARLLGQGDWEVPPSAKILRNPMPADHASLAAAKPVYAENCARCHGDNGGGDGPDASLYKPRPMALNDAKMNQISDGELFWKITTGRRPMPGYEQQLTDEQRWQIVNFLRTFTPKPEAPPATEFTPRNN